MKVPIDDQIRDEKLQYNTNREADKISAWSSGKIGRWKYFTGEQILPFKTNTKTNTIKNK